LNGGAPEEGRPQGRSAPHSAGRRDPAGAGVWATSDDTSYEPGWILVQAAALALAEALREAGLGHQAPHLRAEVNVFGAGAVVVGRVDPATAHRIATLLRSGRHGPEEGASPPEPGGTL
jgi:hypothetical protein